MFWIAKIIGFRQPIFAFMSVHILQINTALQEASVSISAEGKTLGQKINPAQQEHAGFLQPAIAELCTDLNIKLADLQAIAVVNGPGSYTGLRVGLSAAKGICYALNLPLICINTLEWMAFGNLEHATDYICPMIDARRMEVFTALYDREMKVIMEPQPMILEETSFIDHLENKKIAYIGDGVEKWKTICHHHHAHYPKDHHDVLSLSILSYKFYLTKRFADLAYSEPFYTKEFHTKK
jgi:tRNA threonylcarbamoyladenosine biosynthesis protein TsaB